jgi:hypothetical protein
MVAKASTMATDNTRLGIIHLSLRLYRVAAKLLDGFGNMEHSFDVSLRQ